MEKRHLTKKNKYFFAWILTSLVYFIGIQLLYLVDNTPDFSGLLTVLVLLATMPFFSIISGWLAYKGTERVFIPNLITIVIMILVYSPLGILNSLETFQKHFHTFYREDFSELLLDYYQGLLTIAIPIFVVSLISSAITKAVVSKKQQKESEKESQPKTE